MVCAKRTRPFGHVYTRLRANARQRSIAVSLTYEELLGFTLQTTCSYCNGHIPWQPYSSKTGTPSHQQYFLDRKDNARGYDKDNLVVCCSFCNRVRGALFTYEEFLLLAPALKLIQEKRT